MKRRLFRVIVRVGRLNPWRTRRSVRLCAALYFGLIFIAIAVSFMTSINVTSPISFFAISAVLVPSVIRQRFWDRRWARRRAFWNSVGVSLPQTMGDRFFNWRVTAGIYAALASVQVWTFMDWLSHHAG